MTATVKRSAREVSPIDRMIGANIKRLRMNAGISQSELGTRVGVSWQQLQKYECGHNRVAAGRLLQISWTLKCGIAELFAWGFAPAEMQHD